MTWALETIDLCKAFRRVPAVDRLSLAVPANAIYGFLGANGAGKTTTLRLILGLLRADDGQIRSFGKDITGDRARTGMGALIETPSLYAHLTGRENLDLSRRLLNLPVGEIDRVLRIVGLVSASRQRVGGYSLGMKQRLAIARAMLGRPSILVLDEPTNGLDPAGIADMRALLRRLPTMDETTLIVSSHLLNEVQEVATHVGLLHCGRLLIQDPLDVVLSGECELLVGTGDPPAGATLLRRAGYAVREAGNLLSVRSGYPSQAVSPDEIARLLVGHDHSVTHLERRMPQLEEVYHREIARVAA